MAIVDYFDYEVRIARDHMIPWLRSRGALPRSGRVLDVGCGYGGTLASLKEVAPELSAVGLDVDASMAMEGRSRLGEAATIVHADFFEWSDGRFDLILMRDVLEHIRQPERALQLAASMLAPHGWLFVSFAPFYGPFGGHQHNGEGMFSAVPWLQVLPSLVFRRLMRVEGNSYKSRMELEEDMESVLETRLTVRRFVRGARAANLCIRARDSYLSRPDYRIKFGLPALRSPAWPGLDEIFVTGIEALLQNERES